MSSWGRPGMTSSNSRASSRSMEGGSCMVSSSCKTTPSGNGSMLLAGLTEGLTSFNPSLQMRKEPVTGGKIGGTNTSSALYSHAHTTLTVVSASVMELTVSALTQVVCFSTYASVLMLKHPAATRDLFAYQAMIVKAAHNYEGTPWLSYDAHFWSLAATIQSISWTAQIKLSGHSISAERHQGELAAVFYR